MGRDDDIHDKKSKRYKAMLARHAVERKRRKKEQLKKDKRKAKAKKKAKRKRK